MVACLWSPSSPRRVCEVARKVKTRPMVFSCGGFADEPLPRTACASIPRLLCFVVMHCRFWRSCTFGMPMLHARSPCSDAVARCAGSARWSHRVPPCRTLPAPGRQRVVPWHRGSQACFCAGRKSSVRLGWLWRLLASSSSANHTRTTRTAPAGLIDDAGDKYLYTIASHADLPPRDNWVPERSGRDPSPVFVRLKPLG